MGEMKSAWEKAMEKAEQLGKPTQDELKQLEYIPAGNAMAARYLQDEKYDLNAELTKYSGNEARQYILQGMNEIFMRNIVLPHNEVDKKNTTRAMAGIKLTKENKKQLDVIYELVTNLLSYYDQARQQTFATFKKSFEEKIQETAKTLQQQRQGGTGNLEAQLQQQFQDEWRRTSNELDAQYTKALDEHKQQILKIT
jgi:hypothetical protein